MQTLAIRLLTTLFLSLLLFACGDQGPRMDLEINATMNGKLVPHARVIVDGVQMGETGDDGQFVASTNRLPGKQMKIEVTADMPGIEVRPWQTEFTVKLPNQGEVLKYVFDVDLQATPYVAFSVQEKGVPLSGAVVKAGGTEVGKTDDKGEFLYKYTSVPKKPVSFEVSKNGYSDWHQSVRLEAGKKFDVELFKRVSVSIEAMRDEYGQGVGVAGISVSVDGKRVGKTSESGVLIYSYEGAPGKKARITYSAPGYLPAEWTVSVPLDGETPIRHYFYPVTPKPIKVAMYRFVGNTPGADLKEILAQTQAAIRTQLFRHSVFKVVPTESLDVEIRKAQLSLDKMASKGWQGTRLQQMVDMIVVGSVAQDERGFYIEAKFHSASGKLIFSQLIRASSSGDINSAAKEIAENVIERFPFEGTVIALKDDRYEINLGEAYAISRGTEFAVISPAARGGRAGARLVVKKVGESSSQAELGDSKDGEKVVPGDRVVRRVQHEGESSSSASSREFVSLLVKGGVGKDASPLAGVNVYLNHDWVGTTGTNGRAEVTIRTGKSYNLMLYRHGYQQVAEKIRVEKSSDTKEYVMAANTALFKVESTPSNARIYVDGEDFGRTPLAGKPVGLGFHTVRLTVGENYRDWEEVVEFDKKVEDRTGARKITLFKDYMKLGEAAEAKGDVDGAIAAYAATIKAHPDYSSAHHRLAQLYLDEKDDYDGAIREFENVLSLPENEQLLYKQFAIAYTNLGHAYYDKGNETMNSDRNSAAQLYAKAVQNLKVGKQNTRFFPTGEYDEALHDTYFYLALSYQKLYMITKRENLLSDANLAWRDYFDFYPNGLEGDPVFEKHRETARKFWDQIKDR